jgi:hypothetical protein
MRTGANQEPMTIPESEPVDMGEAKCSSAVRGATEIDQTIDQTIDWPPVITLKADNGKYLSRIYRRGQDNCEASKSPADTFCEFQVEVLPDHFIALKGDNGKYLSRIRRGPIDFAEFAKEQIDPFCKFRYYHLGDNKIGLKGDNGMFLSRIYRDGQDNIEVAKTTLDDYSRFEVGENLIKKEFADIEYELDTASVKEEEALATMASVIHNPLETAIQKTLTFTYTKSEVGTWNNEVGVSVGVETEFKTGVPFLAEGKIKVKVDASYSHSWGGSEATTREVADSTEVSVPAKTRLKVQVIVKRALIDVNFTYIIKRLLTNGETTSQKGLRGVYRNMESYESDVVILDVAPFGS